MSRPKMTATIVAGMLMLLVAGFFATREELASGGSGEERWRLVASWTPQEYCLRLYERDGEGGACAYAIPATLNETTAWLVCRDGEPHTLVGGPVSDRAETVRIDVEGGAPVEARLDRVVRLTFFVAEAPGLHALNEVVAFDENGDVVDRMEHTPYPPPYRGDGSTSCN